MESSLVKDLITGRDLASHLQSLMPDSPTALDLIDQIMSSFTKALDALNSSEAKTDDSGKKRKSCVSRRGCNRKRRYEQVDTIVANTLSDKFSWRKYGQKAIHNSKFARAYYRCTHKYDQGCLAIRQVQQKEDDPSRFIITYIGKHSCAVSVNLPDPVFSVYNDPSLISFGSAASTSTPEISVPSYPLFVQNQEFDDEVLSNLNVENSTSALFDELPDFYEENSRLPSYTSDMDMSSMVNLGDFESELLAALEYERRV